MTNEVASAFRPEKKADTTAAVPPRVTGSRQRRVVAVGCRLVALAIFLCLWQVFAGGPRSALPAIAVGRPTSVAREFWHLLVTNQLTQPTYHTLLLVVIAVLISAVAGLALALVTWWRPGRWLLQPLISTGYAVPKVGLIALYIVILGDASKIEIALILSTVGFIYYYAFRQGLDEIDQDRLNALRLMGARWPKIVRSFAFQSTIPQFFAATRVAVPLAFATGVFAEIVLGNVSRLGTMIQQFSQGLNADGAVAVLLFVVFISYVLDGIVGGRMRAYIESIGFGVEGRRTGGRSENGRGVHAVSIGLSWLCATALVLIMWQYVLAPSSSHAVLASPSQVWGELRQMFTHGYSGFSIWTIVSTTLETALIGLVVGVAIGLILAAIMTLSPLVAGSVIEPFVTAVYASPKYVLVPILYILAGNGMLSRTTIVVIAVFPVIAIYTLNGMRTVRQDQVVMMRIFGATPLQTVRKLYLPHTAGYFATALNFAVPSAIHFAVGAELLFGGGNGLGGVLASSNYYVDTPAIYATLTIATVICAVLMGLVRLATGRSLDRQAGAVGQ
jgi:NitT/TauT family transport system permease protein